MARRTSNGPRSASRPTSGAAAIQSNSTAEQDTPDLTGMFAEIKAQARQGMESLRAGTAITGSSALQKCYELADDGERWSQ